MFDDFPWLFFIFAILISTLVWSIEKGQQIWRLKPWQVAFLSDWKKTNQTEKE